MKTYRYEENPLITPEYVKHYHVGFEVTGTFNAGVTRFQDEIIMFLRVAERPISHDPNIVKVPVFNPDTKEVFVGCKQSGESYCLL